MMKINFQGVDMGISQIAAFLGVHPETLRYRIKKNGGNITDRIFAPIGEFKSKHFSKEGKCLTHIAKEKNLKYNTVLKRFNSGYKNNATLGAKVQTS